MSVRKIRNSWWVDFRHEFVRYRKRSPENSQAGAKAYEAQLRARLASGISLSRPQEQQETFGPFAERWMDVYVTTNNKRSEREKKQSILSKHLLPALGGQSLSSITPACIEEYKAKKLQQGLKAKTVNNHLTVLRKALDCAVEWGVLTTIPRIRWLRTTRPAVRYLQEEESQALLRAEVEEMTHLMVLVCLRTGVRIGELLGLRWSDVDFEQAQVTISTSIVNGIRDTPKNRRIRTIPLAPDVFDALSLFLQCRRPGTAAPIFTLDGTSPLTRDQANWRLRCAYRAGGVKQLGWHALRHTFATDLLIKGADIRTVQTLMGHSTILMTAQYTHVIPGQLRQAVSLLCPEAEGRGQQVGNTRRNRPARSPFRPVIGARFSAEVKERGAASATSPSW